MPPQFASLVDHLAWRAEAHPSRPLYTFLPDGETEEATLTFQDVDVAARRLAAHLQTFAEVGDRALLLFAPSLDYPVAFLACLYAGVVAVPAYPPEPGRPGPAMARIDTIIPEAEAHIILTTSRTCPQAVLAGERSPYDMDDIHIVPTDEIALPPPDAYRRPANLEDRLAFLQYTSGSTGAPKGVMVSHRNLMAHQRLSHLVFNREEESTTVSWLPLYHDMGLIGALLYPLYVGGRLVLMPPAAFIRRPMRWLEAIHNYRAGVSTAPDFAYQMCMERARDEEIAALDLSCWELTVCGAEPLKPKTLDDFCRRFERTGFSREAFLPCHGMAEATLMVTGGAHDRVPPIRWFSDKSLRRRAAAVCEPETPGARPHVSCGRPTAEHDVSIVDPTTRSPLDDGAVGEIWFRGPSVCGGYWNRPQLSEEAFQAFRTDGDGPWMRTGDVGFIDDGELFVLGRLHDLLRRDGEWIYPHLHEYDLEIAELVNGPVVLVADPSSPPTDQRIVAMAEVRKSRAAEGESIADQIQRVLSSTQLTVDDVILLPPRTIGRTSSGKLRRFRWAAVLEMDDFVPLYRSQRRPS